MANANLELVSLELLAALASEAPPVLAPPSVVRNADGSGQASNNFTSRLLVAEWLTDCKTEFRVKDQPDGKGRTVYVLKQCPFDSSHGDPDACIMQDPQGKMSAQCFHNSCRGQGWQEFKQAIGAPQRQHYDPPLPEKPRRRTRASAKPDPGNTNEQAPETTAVHGAGTESRLPCIQGNKRQLRDVTADAESALLAQNDPPTVFQRGGILTRLRLRTDCGAVFLEPLVEAALRGVLARVANWTKVRDTKEGPIIEEDAPPMEVVKDLGNLPAWPGIPILESVVECPVFAPTGLVATPGFHPQARLWYQPAPGLEIPAIPGCPSTNDITRARDLLLVELLGDFPFRDDASRAHALVALLLPFVRPLVDGPTPLHLLDAPVEGTGKTLLANVIGLVGTGRPPVAMMEGSCDEEWRKRLTALLAEAPTFILLDNLNRVLDTGSLAAALTARTWKDRLLGFTKTGSFPNTAVWLASGNNSRLSRELICRTVWSRLDAKVDAPWERSGFRHPHLLGWAKSQRGILIAAVLTLVQAWIAAGKPKGRQTLGMFESWAEVIGGILDVAGVPGLLANARDFRASHADQVSERRAFITAWWQEYGEQEVGVDKLFELAVRDKLLDGVLGDKGERSQRIRLGLELTKAVDRVFGDYRIEGALPDHKGRQQYRLRQVGEPTPSVGTDPNSSEEEDEWRA